MPIGIRKRNNVDNHWGKELRTRLGRTEEIGPSGQCLTGVAARRSFLEHVVAYKLWVTALI